MPELWASGKDEETGVGRTKECCGLCEPGIRTSGKDEETGLVGSEECGGVPEFGLPVKMRKRVWSGQRNVVVFMMCSFQGHCIVLCG